MLRAILGLRSSLLLVELAVGFWIHSLSLLAVAGHMLSDISKLGAALIAASLAQRPGVGQATFGYRRLEILVALMNGAILIALSTLIAWRAIERFQAPEPVLALPTLVVAALGLAINSLLVSLLHEDSDQDLNLRGAFLHVVTDAGVSLGVVIAGIAIVLTGWQWFDPVVSLIIVAVVVVSTWQLLKDSVNLALDAVPEGIEPLAVRTYLAQLPGVAAVHDLHIWAMSTTETALTAHLLMPTGHPGDDFLLQLCQQVHEYFSIEHSTIQIEMGNSTHSCVQAPDHTV